MLTLNIAKGHVPIMDSMKSDLSYFVELSILMWEKHCVEFRNE